MMSSVICCVCFVPRAHRPARRDCAVVSRVPARLRIPLSGRFRTEGAFTCSANIDKPNPPLSYTGSSQERPEAIR